MVNRELVFLINRLESREMMEREAETNPVYSYIQENHLKSKDPEVRGWSMGRLCHHIVSTDHWHAPYPGNPKTHAMAQDTAWTHVVRQGSRNEATNQARP